MTADLTVKTQDGKVNIRVAAWFEEAGHLLVCTFPDGVRSLPGGRVKFGETTEQAIEREILEECGVKIQEPQLFAVIENFFVDQTAYHELLFIYRGKIPPQEVYQGLDQAGQTISWLPLEKVDQLKPAVLQRLVTKKSHGIIHLINHDGEE